LSIPTIDYSTIKNLAYELDICLSQNGFFQIRNATIDQSLISAVFRESKAFFEGDNSVKERCRYQSASENFGYQGPLEENLNPNAPADIKSTFTMRNILMNAPAADRWPSDSFMQVMQRFFEESLSFTHLIQQAIANHFGLEPSFFSRAHTGETVTLRLLHYPSAHTDQLTSGQLGAGAHTDYGFLTLLFQDNVSGLQVKGNAGEWAAVPADRQNITVNSGDLLERWTNGRYKSTEHRVTPAAQGVDRFSIALFVDPDPEILVTVLDACTSTDNPAKYPPILARDHVQQKLEASHKGRFK